MAKAVVTDVISAFHIISSISFCLSRPEITELEVHLNKNINGSYLIEQGLLSGTRLELSIKYSDSGLPNRLLLWKFLAFTANRFLKRNIKNPRLYVGHHSYFKPTVMGKLESISFQTFSFEEGIGSYSGIMHHIKSAKLIGIRYPAIKFLLRKILASSIWVDYKWGVIDKTGNLEVKYYKEAIAEFSGLTRDGSFLFPKLSKWEDVGVVFFSSPLVELKLLPKESYADILLKIKGNFESLGLSMKIKPHPLESDVSYLEEVGFDIEKGNYPAEVLLMRAKPQIVAGFNSGSLIIANKLFGIRAISFISFLPDVVIKKVTLQGSLGRIFNSCVEAVEV